MTFTRRTLGLASLLVLLLPLSLSAQVTIEGATITNTAQVLWSDANGNTFVPATASVNVQAGFVAAPDVTSPASVTPASPSTGNVLRFTITNSGNGTDQFSVSATSGAGVTITGYVVGSTTYATLSDLNAALATTNVSSGTSTGVDVIYTVAPARGGTTVPVSLTATSVRTPTASDSSTTNVSPVVSASVNVTPDGATQSRLPSNGTQYTATFSIENTGNAADTFTLNATAGSILTIVSVNGTAGSSSSVTLNPGLSTTVDVVYSVTDAAAGATGTLTLTATSTNVGTQSDNGTLTVTVVRPAISITKEAFRDNQTVAVSGVVQPGEYIQYRITVTNTGSAAAFGVAISDVLPSQVVYQSASGDAAGWIISESSGTVSASLSSIAPSASRHFWIRVRVK
jgi:uncharacterized repeat protein (TIGR01451 family)